MSNMKVVIYYERLFNDGSLIDMNTYVFHNNEWDMDKISDIIDKFYNTISGNLKITLVSIERV